MPDESTNSQPKNSIEMIVAVTERTTAANPNTTNAIPNARNQPQYWATSWGIWMSIPWILPISMSRLLAADKNWLRRRQDLLKRVQPVVARQLNISSALLTV